ARLHRPCLGMGQQKGRPEKLWTGRELSDRTDALRDRACTGRRRGLVPGPDARRRGRAPRRGARAYPRQCQVFGLQGALSAVSMVLAPSIVGLLLVAAVMHASWNALLKSDRSDRLATFGVIMTTGTAMGLCAVPFLPPIEPAAWKYMLLSVAIHLAYYTFLLKAYSYGDLSHTYPIARGLGPLLVALVSGQLIGEHLRTQDIIGVVLLSGSLAALAMPLRGKPAVGGRHGLATLFAVLTGCTIASYII